MEAVNNELSQYVFTHPGVLAALHNMDLADGMALLSAVDVAIREFCDAPGNAQGYYHRYLAEDVAGL